MKYRIVLQGYYSKPWAVERKPWFLGKWQPCGEFATPGAAKAMIDTAREWENV